MKPRSVADYPDGPGAPIQATSQALGRVDRSSTIVLVEGISDVIALETLAIRRGRDLASEAVLIFPIGGAQAIGRYLAQFGPMGSGKKLAGMCDVGEEQVFRGALDEAGLGSPTNRAEMADCGFAVCVTDLEDELLRSVGSEVVEAVFESEGELGSFRTLQRQPEWRDRESEDQMRRFLGSGARRKLRYARLLTLAVEIDRVPEPLDLVLEFSKRSLRH